MKRGKTRAPRAARGGGRTDRFPPLGPGWQRRAGEALWAWWPLRSVDDGPLAGLHPRRRGNFHRMAAYIVRAAMARRR
jgi:hypothetical protein